MNQIYKTKPHLQNGQNHKISSLRALDQLDLRHINLHGLRAAPLHLLLDSVVQAFDAEGELRPGEQLPTALFLVHHWFHPGPDLLAALVRLYRISRSRCGDCQTRWRAEETSDSSAMDASPSHGSPESLRRSSPRHCGRGPACPAYGYRKALCGALRHWILLFPMHFDGDDALQAAVRQLADLIARDGHAAELLPIIDLSNV